MVDIELLKKVILDDMKAFFQSIAEDDTLMMSGNWNDNPRRRHYANTIKDSRAVSNTTFTSEGNNIFKMTYPSYLEYVDYGRKPNGKLPPYKAIKDWCREKLHDDDSKTVWAVMQSIKTFGIKRRRIIALFINHSDYMFDNWSQRIIEALTSEINSYFKK